MTADSGEKAIDLLRASDCNTPGGSEPFVLIVTDLMMPGLSGYDAAQCVKGENRRNRVTPVIMVSAVELTKEETRRHGCATYIPKEDLNKIVSMARIILLR